MSGALQDTLSSGLLPLAGDTDGADGAVGGSSASVTTMVTGASASMMWSALSSLSNPSLAVTMTL